MFQNGEIEQVLDMFERSRKDLPYSGGTLSREPRENWKHGQFYSHGTVNNHFRCYLFGYSFGKAVAGA